MTAKMYYDNDADPAALAGKTVAIIGYGSQGHAHALNLHESGVDVVVGLAPSSKSRRLVEDAGIRVADVAAAASVPGKCLRLEFSVAPQMAGAALTSAGLLIVNPPWTLAGELKAILPELEKPLGQGGAGRFRLEVPKS